MELSGLVFLVSSFEIRVEAHTLSLIRTVLVAFSSFATASMTSDVPLTSDRIFPAISLFMLLGFPLAMVCQFTNIFELWTYSKLLSVLSSYLKRYRGRRLR